MNDVINVIKNRRSVRAYSSEQLKQEELDQIIEAGIYAPTAHNDQPWHFTVIQNKEKLDFINEKSKELMAKSDIDWINKLGSNPKFNVSYNAPTLIIVSGKKNAVSPKVDCSAAIENMLIAAESINIGSVWLGLVGFFFTLETEVKALGVPEDYEPYYGIAFGYKVSDKKLPAPKRNLDVVNYIK